MGGTQEAYADIMLKQESFAIPIHTKYAVNWSLKDFAVVASIENCELIRGAIKAAISRWLVAVVLWQTGGLSEVVVVDF